jgi:Prenyltransferase and squalene oxidase repeat
MMSCRSPYHFSLSLPILSRGIIRFELWPIGGLYLVDIICDDGPEDTSTLPSSIPNPGGKQHMTPKPLSDAVKKGFAYLAERQDPSGGWSQGGGWRTQPEGGRIEGPQVEDPPDVANTCAATLALLRGGNTPSQGVYAQQVKLALNFIVGSVERSDVESPYVTDLRGTQVQTKIGPLADTFLASMVLSEAKGFMPDESSEARLSAALDKVIAKLEKHQQADGAWAMGGWAPVVGQSLGSAGLNRARQRGAKVADETLEKAERYARGQYDADSGSYSMDGSAGVPLYTVGSQMSASSHSVYSFKAMKPRLRKAAEDKTAPKEEQEQAAAKLKNIEEAEAAQEASLAGSYAYIKDENFRRGFGSNGGEEFLSYLNIGEALLAKGGKEWDDWDKQTTENMERIQNGDGGWSGHHCITGRTFCTAAALLVLLADRAPRPDFVAV